MKVCSTSLRKYVRLLHIVQRMMMKTLERKALSSGQVLQKRNKYGLRGIKVTRDTLKSATSTWLSYFCSAYRRLTLKKKTLTMMS
jgi:hypothetical protein